jgi:type IV secretion system protein VirB9
MSLSVNAVAAYDASVDSDSRIKTVIYSENEVVTFVTRHGFQSSVEFAQDETIETISIGDAIGWQITPAGRRIFIKPLQKNGITNLTVITNKHSYQFELVATDSSARYSNHAYVLRFFYPDSPQSQISIEDRTRGDLRPVSPTPIPELPTQPLPMPVAPVTASVLPGEVPPPPYEPVSPLGSYSSMNYNYSLTGPDSLAPTKIYDDGKSTFFEMSSPSEDVKFSAVYPDGSEIPVPARQIGNLAVVDQINQKMTIRRGGELICIFNENLLTPGPMAR